MNEIKVGYVLGAGASMSLTQGVNDEDVFLGYGKAVKFPSGSELVSRICEYYEKAYDQLISEILDRYLGQLGLKIKRHSYKAGSPITIKLQTFGNKYESTKYFYKSIFSNYSLFSSDFFSEITQKKINDLIGLLKGNYEGNEALQEYINSMQGDPYPQFQAFILVLLEQLLRNDFEIDNQIIESLNKSFSSTVVDLMVKLYGLYESSFISIHGNAISIQSPSALVNAYLEKIYELIDGNGKLKLKDNIKIKKNEKILSITLLIKYYRPYSIDYFMANK
jgi:hypothetical protein